MTRLHIRGPAARRLAACAIALAALTSDAALAQTARVEGTLTVVWGDPRPGFPGGETRFGLTQSNGTRHTLQIGAGQQSTAIGYFGQRVAVQGRMTRSAIGVSRITVDQVEPIQPADVQQRAAVVTRRVLYLLLRFKGDTQQPHPPSFFKALTNPKTPPAGSQTPATINGFYDKTSWGKLQWQADVGGKGGLNATGWLTLPKTKNQYAPCGWAGSCADLNAIKVDGLALAVKAGINLAVYDNINFVLNNDLDCCAWGGGIVHNNKFYGATWEPPWGQEAGTYVHELGHSIGLPHSGWVYYAYDSPWDMMSGRTSAQTVQCASYRSANNGNVMRAVNCTEPGSGYIAAYKDRLGWIPAAKQVVIDKKMTKTVTLTANATALSKGIKMIKVCLAAAACTGGTARYFTVEARLRGTQFENGIPGDGVIIHDFQANRGPIGGGDPCFFNTQSGWAVPIDATKGDYNGKPACNSGGRAWPNYGLGNAQFVPGKTYTNTALGIKVAVTKKVGLAYTVKVTRTK